MFFFPRMHPNLKPTLLEKLKSRSSIMKVFNEHFHPGQLDATVQDEKQLVNMRSYMKKQQRIAKHGQPGAGLPDQFIQVLNMVGKNPYLHSFHKDKEHKFPISIMMPTSMSHLIKRCCSTSKGTKKSVLGFDKTFCLTAPKFTTSVFKCHDILHKNGEGSPTLMGPSLLHFESDR